MPLTLYSYIIAEIAGPFWASLAILSGVMFAGKLMKMLEMVFQLNIGVIDFFRLIIYIAPNQLLFSVPMAGTLAVLIAFTRMSNDNEIIAFKTAGLNIYRLLPPVALFAFAITLLSGFTSTQLIPAGRIAMNDLFVRLASEKIDNSIQAKRFSEDTGNMILYIEAIDQETKKWQGVYLSDISDKNNPTTIVSESGSISPHMENMYISIDLQKGTMHRSTQETTQTVEFDRYQVDIPIEQPRTSYNSKVKSMDKNRLTQPELLAQAAKLGEDSMISKSFLVEYHLRMVFAIGTFILSILGMPLAIRNKAGHRNFGVPLGLVFFILYFLAISIGKDISTKSSLPVGLVMWVPNMFFAALTIFIYSVTAKEKWHKILSKLSRQR